MYKDIDISALDCARALHAPHAARTQRTHARTHTRTRASRQRADLRRTARQRTSEGLPAHVESVQYDGCHAGRERQVLQRVVLHEGPRSEPSWPRSLYMSSSSERAPPGCYWTALPRRPGPVSGRTGARRKKVTKWTIRPFCHLFHHHFINRIQPLKKSPETAVQICRTEMCEIFGIHDFGIRIGGTRYECSQKRGDKISHGP